MESLSLQAMTLSDGTTAYVQQDAGGESVEGCGNCSQWDWGKTETLRSKDYTQERVKGSINIG